MSDSKNISFEGELRADGLRFAIVVSRFNSAVTEKLLAGASEAIRNRGGKPEDIDVIRIPGAFEFPAVARANHVDILGNSHPGRVRISGGGAGAGGEEETRCDCL